VRRSFAEILTEAKQRVEEADTQQVAGLLDSAQPPILIDVREKNEWEEGRIPTAVHIPRSFLEERIERVAPNRDQPVVLYCAGGVRSALAARDLQDMGYERAISMEGGFGRWKDQGRPFELPRALTSDQLRRYSRHTLIPEVGEIGQLKLLDAKVLLVGAGGLGSPNALYLAAGGVGTLGIIDSDVVDDSNLQRQVIHTTDRVGKPKVESAQESIKALNPDVTVDTYYEPLTKENAHRIIAPYDIVVDGGDNFDTRYLLNQVAVELGKPNVSASILSFDGQLTTFVPGEGPCYRCIFPEPPPPGMAPSCGQSGVLGVLPGVMGLLQATEVLKLILGIGDPLVGRLLVFDALPMSFYELKLRRDPDCPVCGHLYTSKQTDSVRVAAIA
jgi:molybdopterin/thiamine biosynthesis adenylyltransferase/rhodanese-related sulfurtransferase